MGSDRKVTICHKVPHMSKLVQARVYVSEDISQPFLILSGLLFSTQLWNKSWSLCTKHADWKHFKVKWSKHAVLSWRKYAKYNAITLQFPRISSDFLHTVWHCTPLYSMFADFYSSPVCVMDTCCLSVCVSVCEGGELFSFNTTETETLRDSWVESQKSCLCLSSLSLCLPLFLTVSSCIGHHLLSLPPCPSQAHNAAHTNQLSLFFPIFSKNTAGDSLYFSNSQNMSVYHRHLEYSTDII